MHEPQYETRHLDQDLTTAFSLKQNKPGRMFFHLNVYLSIPPTEAHFLLLLNFYAAHLTDTVTMGSLMER